MAGSIRAALEKAMRKRSKDDPDVMYKPSGAKPNHHCGPDEDWPHGFCEYFQKPNECQKVSGIIATKGRCLLYERAKGE
jgi:hypothetical protein